MYRLTYVCIELTRVTVWSCPVRFQMYPEYVVYAQNWDVKWGNMAAFARSVPRATRFVPTRREENTAFHELPGLLSCAMSFLFVPSQSPGAGPRGSLTVPPSTLRSGEPMPE